MSILFDPLQAAVRRALEYDPDTRERVRALGDRVVEIEFTGLERTLFVAIDQGTVSFSRRAPRAPDLRLIGSPMTFARVAMAPERVEITESGIRIEGDVGLAQRFARLLRQLDIDWEEWASRYVGDVLAHRAGRFAEGLRDWAQHSREQFRQDVSEYLQEEVRLLAPRERVVRLMNEIDETRSDVERLAARIRRLDRTR